MSLREAFFRRVNKTETCWEWAGPKDDKGYGKFGVEFGGKKRNVRAHRLAWALERGLIPKGLFVCHHCDNPSCVRVDHLFLGTPKDNTRDMYSKGREAYRKGAVPEHLKPFCELATQVGQAAKNRTKTNCSKCGGPLVPVNLASQGNRRRCPPCTQKAKNAYLKLWKAQRKNRV